VSAPFGGHPTLAHYLHWIRETGGHAECGFKSDRRGRAHALVKITSAEGKSVIVVGIPQTERIEPTYVAFLDRRLGVKSPWFTVPE
jgi:hypothetical protein